MDKLINTRRAVLMLIYPFINYLSQTLVFTKDTYPILIKKYHTSSRNASIILYHINNFFFPLYFQDNHMLI